MDQVIERSAPSTDRMTLTVCEAAKALGVSRNIAYDAVATGKIPSVRIGTRILIPRAALEKMLNGE